MIFLGCDKVYEDFETLHPARVGKYLESAIIKTGRRTPPGFYYLTSHTAGVGKYHGQSNNNSHKPPDPFDRCFCTFIEHETHSIFVSSG